MRERVVITGWGQVTQPKSATPPYLDPVDMMESAARAAGAMSGDNIFQCIDTILVVRTQSRALRAPGEEIARRLGIKAKVIRVSGIGGEVPQHFVNQAAGMLARGESQGVLICGAETFYPRSADSVRGEGTLLQGIPDDYDADDAVGSNELEQRHGLTLPIHGFPLFETALWAKSGLDRSAWLERVGSMWSRFSEVAAKHANAWSREPVPLERIVTPAPDNRPICFPYTKRMVSLVTADLGAAIVMATERQAQTMTGGAATPVYFLGGAFAKDRQRFMIDKADYTRSQALAEIARKTQQRAGIRIDEVAGFDLYSCFPCAVNVARGELGIVDEDPRPLTQTGGLGFFGGPGSNYALHGIASLAENIANGKLDTGMATAIGWFMHKYAAGIYSVKPADTDLTIGDTEDLADPEAGAPPVAQTDAASGEGTLETYTVIYARDHSPEKALLYGKTDDGLRFVANSDAQADTFDYLTTGNRVGARVALRYSPASQTNRAHLLG